ncbi:MAG: hypothetical protein ACYCSJ_01415 [Acidimicrobiales bacterium]
MHIHAIGRNLSAQVVERSDYLDLSMRVTRGHWTEDDLDVFLTDDQAVDVLHALATSPRVVTAAGATYVQRAVETALALAKVSTDVRDQLERALRAMDDDERPVAYVEHVCTCGHPADTHDDTPATEHPCYHGRKETATDPCTCTKWIRGAVPEVHV